MSALVVIWLIVAFVCGLLGYSIGQGKGRPGEGLLLGLLLGVFGILIIAVMSPTPEAQAHMNEEVAAAQAHLAGGDATTLRRCPWCAELIQPAAKICRYCNRDVEPVPEPESVPEPPRDPENLLPPPTALPRKGEWLEDPSGRHFERWWDGGWTEHVRDQYDNQTKDPPLRTLS